MSARARPSPQPRGVYPSTDVKVDTGAARRRGLEADEYYAEWYRFTERLAIDAGLSKRVTLKGCFYNQAWGLQSHIVIPSELEMRNSHRIGGKQPGEPEEITGARRA
ncbi:hypothetical protein LTR37_020267 [Vermiconidia calcicola]|uniref:Uncharacterized protein n=1 Tax=Vermiconidia calcicola TaxID=1690605 RepID=A0ACC3MDB9_9PEZI|nr:hypothetical protein LTR37_020267 [Vermiconidia calcicola]